MPSSPIVSARYLMTGPAGARTTINNREVDYFCGTGYYNLHANAAIIEAACDATQHYGIGAATSRAGFGETSLMLEVEEKAAQFFAAERAMYFVSGYLGNAILLQGLSPDYEIIFVDEQSHYSVIDGAAIARKPTVTFAHCDPVDLAEKLRVNLKGGQRPLVITDGIFPNSGVIPPLQQYDKLLSSIEGAILCVDDAHAVGVIGELGRGSLEYCDIEGPRRYSCGTFSKAFGGHGGVIAGGAEFIESIKRNSHITSGASAAPIPAAAASACAIELLNSRPEMRQKLWANVAYAKNAFRQLGFDFIPDTPVPIICLSDKTLDLESIQKSLFERGIATLYSPFGSYSCVPEGGSIRIAIFSSHSKEQIDRLVHEADDFI